MLPTFAPDTDQLQRFTCSAGTFTERHAASPRQFERTQAQCDADGCDDIHLVLGETIELTDFARPCILRWPRRSLHLDIPRDAVAAALGTDPGFLHGRTLSENGLAPMLATQLHSLASLAPNRSDATRSAALRATIELALTALATEFGRIARAQEGSDERLFAAVNRYIQQELASRRLTPAVIAAHVGCSRAHLYRLFARRDLAVADYIREARLQRVLVALQSEDAPRETIATIALRCGFENPVYFARLFKQRFGRTPQDVRRGRPVQPSVPALVPA